MYTVPSSAALCISCILTLLVSIGDGYHQVLGLSTDLQSQIGFEDL